MLRLVYSNRTEELLAELAVAVRAQQARDGALVPVRVVVPTTALEGYVRLGIAREQGVAANVEVTRLTPLAAELAVPAGARLADAGAIEAMALELLLDPAALSDPALAAVRRYVASAGDDEDAADARRVQLASRVGRLFEEYTYTRAEMLAAWSRGEPHGAAEAESWQRPLWRRMFGPGGLASRRTPPLVPLHEAVAAMGRVAPRGAVHLFGLAHVARTFHELLARLSRTVDVTVYALSPCEGLWEDGDARDPTILTLWGRPGREAARALNALSGFDHDDRFVDPLEAAPHATLLARVQRDVLRREPAGARVAPDESLLVLEHASVRRECEAVASAIWARLEADETLRLDEIAVLVPPGDASAYLAHLAAAFREAHGLPMQRVGVDDGATNRVREAVDLLLSLPLGTFTRPEVLRLAVHPLVAATCGEVDPARWVGYCAALGIVHGVDRSDHAGTYLDRDLLSWDQGLRRLALGSLMAEDAPGEPAEPLRLGDDEYWPLEVQGTELHDAASFGVLVRSLLADARHARAARLSPAGWARLFAAAVEAYVTPVTEAEADDLAHVLRRLGALADVDLGGRVIGYRAAYELARARLPVASSSRGEGVLVSTIAAARGVPLRVVFACGLGEGLFPAPEADDPLDVRGVARLPGDVTPRERDRYALLEVLLGARDALALSYVSRNAMTGEALPASSVVEELIHLLSERYLADAAAVRRRHPLRRWDRAYFSALRGEPPSPLGTTALPEAAAEARTVALRERAEAAGLSPSLAELASRAEQGEPGWVELARHLGLPPLPPPRAHAETRVVVPISTLVKFLEQPLQGWARHRLGFLQEDEEDAVALDVEPLETPARDATLLLRDVFFEAADSGQAIPDVYDARVHARAPRGLGPSGLFARGERADHLRTLDEWRASVAAKGVAPGELEVHRLGPGRADRRRVHHTHEPLSLDLAVRDAAGVEHALQVEIGGHTSPAGGAPRLVVALGKRANEGWEDWSVAGRHRWFVRALVDHAVLVASGAVPPGPLSGLVVVSTPDKGPVRADASFAPMSPERARGWLRDILQDLLGGPHAYFLPCEAAFVHQRRGRDGALGPVLLEARARRGPGGNGPGLSSSYGLVPHPEQQPVPDEATARAMIERRLGPILDGLAPGGGE